MGTIGKAFKKIVFAIVKPPHVPASYSQAGEDAVLQFLFYDKHNIPVTYLDIGTNIPDHNNNTYLFYKKKSRGVCVEANKAMIPAIKALRPEDKILNVGVAVGEATEADFYIFDADGINTFDKEEAEYRSSSGRHRLLEVVKVPLININDLIAQNFDRYPDLLSLDIEGLDLAVLKSLDFEKYPIPVICVETCEYSENHIRPKDPSFAEFMLSKDYFIYADTYINTIFVNKSWFHKV